MQSHYFPEGTGLFSGGNKKASAGELAKSLGYEEKTLTFSGELATLVCKREQLDDGYRSMLSQLHEIDYQIIGASYEIYYEDGTVELKIPVCKYLEATNPEPHLVAMPYSIETMNGRAIMFLEIPRRYEDGSRDAVPQLLVFEKVHFMVENVRKD